MLRNLSRYWLALLGGNILALLLGNLPGLVGALLSWHCSTLLLGYSATNRLVFVGTLLPRNRLALLSRYVLALLLLAVAALLSWDGLALLFGLIVADLSGGWLALLPGN